MNAGQTGLACLLFKSGWTVVDRNIPMMGNCKLAKLNPADPSKDMTSPMAKQAPIVSTIWGCELKKINTGLVCQPNEQLRKNKRLCQTTFKPCTHTSIWAEPRGTPMKCTIRFFEWSRELWVWFIEETIWIPLTLKLTTLTNRRAVNVHTFSWSNCFISFSIVCFHCFSNDRNLFLSRSPWRWNTQARNNQVAQIAQFRSSHGSFDCWGRTRFWAARMDWNIILCHLPTKSWDMPLSFLGPLLQAHHNLLVSHSGIAGCSSHGVSQSLNIRLNTSTRLAPDSDCTEDQKKARTCFLSDEMTGSLESLRIRKSFQLTNR